MMGKSIIVICLLLAGNLACAETVFYLHGRIIEVEGVQPTHPRFGLYDYLGVVDALQANGATVIADVRSGNTNVLEYAHGVVDQIEALIESGEPANNITVVGFSKGGAIAIYEESDAIAGSCKELVQRNDEISSFRELKLSTGKEHGAFYLPRAVWVEPLLAWIDEGHE